MRLANRILSLPLPVLNHWGYWAILFITILEAMPFGFMIPGHALVILSGFLAHQGVLDIGDVIWVASLGAIIGDFLNYLLGRKYGYKFFSEYGKYFFFKKEYFEKTKKLMNSHAGKTLIIGRFNLVTRSFAPFVAGASDVGFTKFLTYNVIGGVAWAVSSVLIGYFFGKSYEIVSRYTGGLIALTVVALILAAYAIKKAKKHRYI